jgi:hypothetical protein
MKLLMLVGAALVVSAQTAQAQFANLQIGPTGGIALSTLVGDGAEDEEARTGAYFGGSLVVQPRGSMFGFETGLLHVPKGASLRDTDGSGALRLSYLEVPLLLRVGFSLQQAALRPFVLVGGSLAFNTGCTLEERDEGRTVSFDCADPLFGDFLNPRTLDLGVSGGLGIDIPTGAVGVLSPHVRFTRGLTNVFGPLEEELKNSVVQAGVSFRFTL